MYISLPKIIKHSIFILFLNLTNKKNVGRDIKKQIKVK